MTVQVVSEVTLFWSLYNAGLNGDFGVAADMIDDDCEIVMMPTMETSRGKAADLKAMGRGAGAIDRTRPPKIIFDAATSDWGVFEFVNKAPSPVESSTSPRTLTGSFLRSQHPGRTLIQSPVCMVDHINAHQKIHRIHEYTDVASLMRSIT